MSDDVAVLLVRFVNANCAAAGCARKAHPRTAISHLTDNCVIRPVHRYLTRLSK